MRNFLYFASAALAAVIFGVVMVSVVMDVFPRWQLITLIIGAVLLGMWVLISWIVHEEQKWDRNRRFFRD